jgi:xylulokinase
VDAGQVAVILGTSTVVNGSSAHLPTTDHLDAMRLNWGPYLWMRCYMNGAGFVNHIVGPTPDWADLEAQARAVEPGCHGVSVSPFLSPEPSLGVVNKCFEWDPKMPSEPGKKFRAALEALAYLIALGIRQHEEAGQIISRITVSGGLAKSRLMCEILASVLKKPLELLVSDEGPALGAAVTALAAFENHRRQTATQTNGFPIAGAVQRMVKFRPPVAPNEAWMSAYDNGLKEFKKRIVKLRKGG